MKTISAVYRHAQFYCLSLLLFGTGSQLQAQAKDFFILNGHKKKISAFDKEIATMIREVGTPGISLAVISNNRVVYANGYGYKVEGKPDRVDKATIFEACSVSKTYLGITALKLADHGKLDLDKPLYEYLPYPLLAHDARYKQITARMVLSHSSGIENWKSANNPDTLDIVSDPGTSYVYSGEGYEYLALVIADILHKPYQQYIQEMILQPLGVQRTFLSYSKDGSYPLNYATGHSMAKKPGNKWKNAEPLPAAGINVSAADYAAFLVWAFNNKNLTPGIRENVLKPVILMDEENPHIFRSTAFEVLYSPNDTIISHSGNNVGFRAFIAYSVVSKNGFVLFTNGDAGILLAQHLSELTAGINIRPFFQTDIIPQYPHPAFRLLGIYREQQADSMFAEISRWRAAQRYDNLPHLLNALSELFFHENRAVEKRILEDNIRFAPDDPEAYYLLGEAKLNEGDYQEALELFVKCRNMRFNVNYCDEYISQCQQKLKQVVNH